MTATAPPAASPARSAGSETTGRTTGSTTGSDGTRPGAWREPAYVLLFVAGVFADMVNGGSAKLLGFPISPDRLLFGGALVLVLADADARRRVRLRWRSIHTLMVVTLAFVVYSAVSVGTLTSTYGLYAIVDRLLMPFVAFSLAPVVFRTPARRDLLLRALVVMGIYLGLTGIFEVVGPHSLVYPRFIMDPDVGIHFGSARGPLLEAESDGLVQIGCGLAAGLLFTRSTGWWRRAAAVAVPLCVIGAFLSQERSIWIGEGLAILSTSLLVPRLRRLLPVTILAVAAVLAIGLALSPQLRADVFERSTASRSVYDRQNTNAAAIRIIEAKPLTGIGWVEFEEHGREWVKLSPDYPITTVSIEVHNVYLGRASEIGVPGTALFVCCLLGGPGRAALRRFRPGFGAPPDAETAADDDRPGWYLVSLGMTLAWGMVSLVSPLPYPLGNLLVWLFAGIVLTPYLASTPPRRTDDASGSAEVTTAERRAA